MIDNERNCASCGAKYKEVREVWPQFPQCSLCYPTKEEIAEKRTPENVFRYYLQVAHGIKVTNEQASQILKFIEKGEV